MHSHKLHILNIPELDRIIIEIKDYFDYDVNYFNKKKDLLKKIDEDKKFLENAIILVNQKDFSFIKNKTIPLLLGYLLFNFNKILFKTSRKIISPYNMLI